MRKMSISLRKELAADPFYKQCCITGISNEKLEWHHNLIYAGTQVNEKWCILPLTESIHRDIVKYKEKCNWIMLNRATDEDLIKYSKAVPYIHLRDTLNKKYGRYIRKG